jgi:hypothetical protein
MNELEKAEALKKADIMIPERDTSAPKYKSKFSRNAQSKINTGLRKPLDSKAPLGKENVPQKLKTKVWK